MAGIFRERGFERLVRELQRQRVAAALLFEKIGAGELDFEIVRPRGGEVAIEFHGGRAVSLGQPGTDGSLHEWQRERIGGAGVFKAEIGFRRIAAGLGQHAEREVRLRISRRGERGREQQENARIPNHADKR